MVEKEDMLVRELPEQENHCQSWICGSCNNVWFDQELAERCCQRTKCQKCSALAGPGDTLCAKCLRQVQAIHEEEMFRSAQKVFYSDYEGKRMCWTPPGCRFVEVFGCRTELEKRCSELRVPPPRWCWAAEELGFLLDAEQVLAGAVTRTNEPVRPLLSDDQVEGFQKLIDDWAMSQDLKCYEVDDTLAIVFDRTLYDTVRPKDLPAKG